MSCPFTNTIFTTCTNNEYQLVRTTKSSHFWAIQANSDCSAIAEVVPCRQFFDLFDPVTGCCPKVNDKTLLSVEGGYMKLESTKGVAPEPTHCSLDSHIGRMVSDSLFNLYVCGAAGWVTFSCD